MSGYTDMGDALIVLLKIGAMLLVLLIVGAMFTTRK